MAEEQDESQKTEEPTQKRLDETRERGQIASSREINHWFMILAATVALMMFLPSMLQSLQRALVAFVERPHAIALDDGWIRTGVSGLLLDVAGAIALPLLIMVIAAIGAGLLQAGTLFAPEVIKPKLEKISPAKGFKRLFSVRALVEFAKSLAKLAIVAAVCWIQIRPEFLGIERFVALDTGAMLAAVGDMAKALFIGVLAVMTGIAALDFLYEKTAHLHRLRMSRQDLREEFKQSEGDPIVRSRLKQIRMERARLRMMQEVPKATVVITNPTHFAVALRYDQDTMAAPKLVAKGVDLVAHRIRDLAVENDVPVVENPPLARTLHASVDINREIPPELYRAVAEVIGYVMRLRRARPVD